MSMFSVMNKYAEHKLICMVRNSKGSIAVPVLGKEYHDTFGHEFPCKELGFASLEEYLKNSSEVYSMWSEKSKCYFVSYKPQKSSVKDQHQKNNVFQSSSRGGRSYRSTGTKHFRLGEYGMLTQIRNSLIHLVKNQNDGITIPELNMLYEEETGEKLNLYDHGFNTLYEFVDTVEDLIIVTKSGTNKVFWTPAARNSNFCKPALENHRNQHFGCKEDIEWADDLDNSLKSSNVPVNESHINETVKSFFRAVLKNHPEGVWASQFPQKYKELAGYYFEMQNIGYYNFITLVEDHPSIFAWTDTAFSSGDFLLFDAEMYRETEEKLKGREFDKLSPRRKLKTVISNIKKLLSLSEEGISLDEFFYVYKLNFGQLFNLEEFGYQSLKAFLGSVAGKVPLCLISATKVTKIYSFQSKTPDDLVDCVKYPVPSDIVTGNAKYKPQWIPNGVNPESFMNVYVASFIHPDDFYIQFDDGDTLGILDRLMDDLQSFYNSDEGELYRMHEIHMKQNFVCVALHSSELWHRIEILEESHMSVQAFFVDYGTTEDVDKQNLRYLRKQFYDIPSQAVKARLAGIRPCSVTWPSDLQNEVIEMVADKCLRAFIYKYIMMERILYLYLWDTTSNTPHSYSINDLLVYQRYASFSGNAAEQAKAIHRLAWQSIVNDQDYCKKLAETVGNPSSEVTSLSASFGDLSFHPQPHYGEKTTLFHEHDIATSAAQCQYNGHAYLTCVNCQTAKNMTAFPESNAVVPLSAFSQNSVGRRLNSIDFSDKLVLLSRLQKAPDITVHPNKNECSQNRDFSYSFLKNQNQQKCCDFLSSISLSDKMHIGNAFINPSYPAALQTQNLPQKVHSANFPIISEGNQEISTPAEQFSIIGVGKTSKSECHKQLPTNSQSFDKAEEMCDFILPPCPPKHLHSSISSSVFCNSSNEHPYSDSTSTFSTHSPNSSLSPNNIYPTSPSSMSSFSLSSRTCDLPLHDGSVSPVSCGTMPVLFKSSAKRNEPEVYNEMYECRHENFFKEYMLKTERNVKRLCLKNHVMVHIIKLMGRPHISCHDLALIIVGHGNVKSLMEKVDQKGMCRYPKKIYKTNDEVLFEEIESYGIKEITHRTVEGKCTPVLTVFPLGLAFEYIFALTMHPEEIVESMKHAIGQTDLDDQ